MIDLNVVGSVEDRLDAELMARRQLGIVGKDDIHPNLTYVRNTKAHAFTWKPMIRLLVKPLRDENGGEKPFTLINIEKHIEFQAAYEIRIDSSKYVGGVLNLLKLPNLTKVYATVTLPQPADKRFINPFNLALAIVSNHLLDKDTIACQRELIENDLDEYAEFCNSFD